MGMNSRNRAKLPIVALCHFLGMIVGPTSGLGQSAADTALLSWDALPDIPSASGQAMQIGLAGPFAGIHADALIVAGGANFPGSPPWQAGIKVWWDDVFVLSSADEVGLRWNTETYKLPRPLAYGVSISTSRGLICIGGCDSKQCYADVYRLRWVAGKRRIEIEKLPPLPVPLAEMGGSLVGQTIYVAGGRETSVNAVATTHCYALDLSLEDQPANFRWRELPSWPGPPRVLPVVAAQNDGESDCLFVLSGRNIVPGKSSELLVDGYKLDTTTRRWRRVADVATRGKAARCVMGAAGIGWGANHILVFGGDDGRLLLLREQIGQQLAESRNADERNELQAILQRNFTDHPGFSRDVLAYHTVTDTWTTVGEFPPNTSRVTTTAVRWNDSIIIPSGEIRPGVRSPGVLRVTLADRSRFGAINYAVLGIYLLSLMGMGLYFARRERSTEDFFRAGGRIPWWAAGISIFGTTLSAVTYMSLPAKTFATDWRYLMINVAIVLVAPLIVYLFLPLFRRLNVTTAYEYLEQRFNLPVRLFASLQFILFQLGRIGIVLFLPSLALSTVTGIDVHVCIVLMGGMCVFYTVLGGIEAVIWTDVIQVIVLMGGAVLCLAMMTFYIPGGWNAACEIAEQADKFRTFDFRLDFGSATFWVLLLGGFGDKLVSYGTDQTVIQRYLTTKDEASARRGIWLNAIIAMPATLLFFGLGTALYVFFHTYPESLTPEVGQQDAIFPWYIVTQLPAGLAGLLIAGLFAASMSSLDSSMNSVATAVTTDFYRRFRPLVSDHALLVFARAVTIVVGILGTTLALAMTEWNIQSLWDQMGTVLGLFGGGLAGLFLLAIFSRRTSSSAALIALAGSFVLQIAIQQADIVHPWALAFTGIVSCLLLGTLLSTVLPNRKPLEGLTFYTLPAGVD